MHNFSLIRFACALLALSAFLTAGCTGHADPSLAVMVGAGGITSLTYNGVSVLHDGDFSLDTAISGGGNLSVTPTGTSFNAATSALTKTYAWGSVTCTYKTVAERLNVTIQVKNESQAPLDQITVHLLDVDFPQAPAGWVHDYVYVGSNYGDPTIETADYGTGELAVVNDDIDRPLLVGFPGRASLTSNRPIVVSTAKGWVLSPYLDPYIGRPIPAGKSDTYHISLRFAPSGTSEKALAGDIYAMFAAAYPSTLNWADRRPVGALHLATSEDAFKSATNPRGWFSDPKGVDVTTPDGLAAFKTRVMSYADGSIAVLKATNAQGMIVWDIEGEQYPQATTYIGDPRLLGKLAPEMDAIADQFFKKFTDAGLKTGLSIRPQQLVINPDGTASQKNVDDPAAMTDMLVDKMSYAAKRWGCSIFYVDSNGDPNVPYPAIIFRDTAARMAKLGYKCLIVPEHHNTQYMAYTAPYGELRLGVTGSSTRERTIYPSCFRIVYVPDGPVDQDMTALTASVKRGDSLMFRGWWPDSFNDKVRAIYQAAGK